ncbi:TonB-dependent receptor [Acidiphilium sp.]|uniref:TonB-dependent receptor n=1 Tax=Acidiphilium sp. TaxID=527 RepID=UPI003CFE613A
MHKAPTFHRPRHRVILLSLSSSIALTVAAHAQVVVAPPPNPINIKLIKKIERAEHGTGSVSREAIRDTSPVQSFQSVLRTVPGFTVRNTNPGNLTAGDTTFTYEGFNSDQVAMEFDGVPIINAFRGGTNGQGDDHSLTPVAAGQFDGVTIYSGANSPSETGINGLGGTIDYHPVMPSSKFYATIYGRGGSYASSTQGGLNSGGFSINSGTMNGSGTELYGNFDHSDYSSYLKHVFAVNNNSYLSAVQPYDQGRSQFSFILINNDERAQQPVTVPLALAQKYGNDFQWPINVANNRSTSRSFTTIVGWRSIINNYVVARTKLFYTQNNNDRTGYGNAEYAHGYEGYEISTAVKSYANPAADGIPDNTYNPTALFGSSDNGTQYQRYIDNFSNLGITPSLSFLLPHNTVTVGATYIHSYDRSAEYWYGEGDVPRIDGYNDAWDEHDQRNYADIYIQDHIRLLNGKLSITPGIKYYSVLTTCNDISGYYYDYAGTVKNRFNFSEPSFGVSYELAKNLDVYAHYGRVYKLPNISAYYAVIGNAPTPGLELVRPEYVDSVDAGVRYNFGRFKTKLAYFRRAFSNKFGYYYNDQTGETYQYNVGTALYQGATASIDAALTDTLSTYVNYDYTLAKYTSNYLADDGASVYSGELVGGVPLYNLNFGIQYKRSGLLAKLTDNLVGPWHMNTDLGSPAGLPAVHPYNIVDLNVGYSWKTKSPYIHKWTFNVYVDNLFDTNYYPYEYQQFKGGPASDRNPVYVDTGAPLFIGAGLKLKLF